MTASTSNGVTRLLRALAMLQGVAIAVLAVLVLGGGDAPPVQAAPSGAPAAPAAPAAAQSAQRASDGGAPATSASSAPNTVPSATRAPGEEATAAATTAATASAAAGAAAEHAIGTVLYGRVVDDAGETIPQAIVWLTRVADGRQLATVRTDERSQCFAIAGLGAGEIAYNARAAGFKEQHGTIAIPSGTAQLRHDIVLIGSWQLAVKILTPDGEPVRAALAAAAKERPNLHFVEVAAVVTRTPPEGDFPPSELREIRQGLGRWQGSRFGGMPGNKQLPKDVAGVVEIDEKQPLWVSAVLRHRVLASVAVEPGQPEVTLTIGVEQVLRDLGTIRGRIVDAGGAPLADAHVGFGDRQSGGMRNKVDANARFETRNLRPGLLTMEVSSAERSSHGLMVLLEPGQTLDLGDVPMRELRTIKGRCEGLLGNADECRIYCMALDAPPHPALRHYDQGGSVAADGTFSLWLGDGRYRVRATGAGGAVMDVDTRTLPDPFVLQLRKESSMRLDVQTNGEPCELAVFDARGRELWRRELLHGWKFALPFLPGDYRIELKDGRGKVDTRRITLGDSGADVRVP